MDERLARACPAIWQDGGVSDVPAEPAESSAAQLVFRLTPVSLLAVMSLAVCLTPIAWLQPWTLSLYAIPLLLAAWILRSRTTVDAQRIQVRWLVGGRSIAWHDVAGFQLREKRWVVAQLASGGRVRLPSVHVRDMVRLAEFSGGRVPDLSSETEDDADLSDGQEQRARPKEEESQAGHASENAAEQENRSVEKEQHAS